MDAVSAMQHVAADGCGGIVAATAAWGLAIFGLKSLYDLLDALAFPALAHQETRSAAMQASDQMPMGLMAMSKVHAVAAGALLFDRAGASFDPRRKLCLMQGTTYLDCADTQVIHSTDAAKARLQEQLLKSFFRSLWAR